MTPLPGLLGGSLNSLRTALEQGGEALLIQHLQSQLLSLIQLRAGVRASNHKVGPLRYRTGCLTAARNNGFLRAITGVTVQRAGHDHGQTLQGAFHGLVTGIFHAHTGGSP